MTTDFFLMIIEVVMITMMIKVAIMITIITGYQSNTEDTDKKIIIVKKH